MNNRSLMIRSILFLFLSLHITHCLSQSVNDLVYYQEKFKLDKMVKLNKDLKIDISMDGEDIVITRNSVEEDLFLNKAATQFSKESVSYSTFYKLENVEASSFNIENDQYQEYKVSEFRRKNELDGSFHDDVKSVNFIYPNLNEGSKTRLITQERVMNPRFLGAFFFGGYYPVIKSKLEIIVDKNINMKFKEFNTDNVEINFSKKEKRNKTIYTWESKNIESFKMEERTPNYKNYFPHIFPIIETYSTKNDKKIQVLSNTSDLYNWYYSMVENINSKPLDKELINLVHQITKNKESEFEKVKAIYYWVQNNIKYIAFEYALGGFVPRDANDIFIKKFGDCKDNSSLLYEMLKIIGVKGRLTWIGTREIPYKYDELPTPSVDNHMILTYRFENKDYFLDATGRFIPLEMPTSFIQGKEALIGNGDSGFDIKMVPIVEAKDNAEWSHAAMKIKDKGLIGKGLNVYSGYRKIDVYNKLENLNTNKKIKLFYKDYLQKGNNKFIVENEKEENKYDYDKSFKVSYDFTISDYLVKTSDEIYVNLNLNKVLLDYEIEKSRETDIEVRYKNYYKFVNELEIPEGYTIDFIPENVKFENKFVTAEINYEIVGNKIIYTHQLQTNFLVLEIENKTIYNDLVKKLRKAYNEIIILKKMIND